MLATLLALGAVTAIGTSPTPTADTPSSFLSGRTFACVQSVPAPTADRPTRVNRGRIAFATDYVPAYLRAGEQGSFASTATGVRFTSGPLVQLARGARVVGTVRPAARNQLVLRSRPATGRFRTPWSCRSVD